MSEELLVRHCSPTLAGMKTGNLFACSFPNEDEMKECVRCWNRTLKKKDFVFCLCVFKTVER